jgi:transketolase
MTINPLKIQSKLSNSFSSEPLYKTSIKNSKGEEVICADPRATRALVALMDLGAVNGGAASHWGGPAAMAESMSALHSYMFQAGENWAKKYHFVNDIGHAENGIYALRANWGFGDLSLEDLKGFRSIDSKLTGHGENLHYPEGVLLSNGPLSSAVGQAQGLAMGDKITGSDRITFCAISDGASMEGEAKEAFAAISGLSQKGKINPFIMLISDNNTKLGGRISEDSFDMSKTFDALEVLGWHMITVEKGNDLEACYQAIEKAVEYTKTHASAVAIRLKTVKGYGVKSTEEHKSGGHGFPLGAYSQDITQFIQEIYNNEAPDEFLTWAKELTVMPEKSEGKGSVKKDKMQVGIANALNRAAKEGLPVFSLSSDLQGSTGVAGFHKENADRFIDLGIAESNMVSAAAGLSKSGLIPVVDTFAAFGITKGNLPHVMAALSDCPIIGIYSHAGFQDAADGASHQSLTYFSALSSIPNVEVISLSCSDEAEALVYEAIKNQAILREKGEVAPSTIFFLGREKFPLTLDEEFEYKIGKAQVLKEGTDATVVATGPMVHIALKAAKILEDKGRSITVINSHHINKPDVKTIKEQLLKCSNRLITIEDHQVIGGMGSLLTHALKMAGVDFTLSSLGVKGHFGQSAYTAAELYSKAGIDEKAIVELLDS